MTIAPTQWRAPTDSKKPWVLFDINNTLLEREYLGPGQRRYHVRPGISRLLELRGKYHLGIYSSVSERNARYCVEAISDAIGDELDDLVAGGAPAVAWPSALFEVVLAQKHCVPDSPERIAARGGDEWDVLKPLQPYFPDLGSVVLVEESEHKSLEAERSNLLLVPAWHAGEKEQAPDTVLPRLVKLLSDLASSVAAGEQPADMRCHAARISTDIMGARVKADEEEREESKVTKTQVNETAEELGEESA